MFSKYLESSWFSLSTQLELEAPKSKIIFRELTQAYSQTARKYHTLEHITELLKQIEELQTEKLIKLQDSQLLQLATWFHDYVYEPQQHDCEISSAIYAESTLATLGLDAATVQQISRIIRSTQDHLPRDNSINNLLFLDLDLSILGANPERYQVYAQAIREEYDCFSDRQYQTGRKQILASFLSRERIYYTDYFFQKLEKQARSNIESELLSLTSR